MTQAEVKSLRDQQRYEEAAKLSRQLLQEQPTDIWRRRSHAWSLYYLVKKKAQSGEKDSALSYLAEFDQLAIPADDALVHEKITYFRQAIQAGYVEVQTLIRQEHYTEALRLQIRQNPADPQSVAWTLYYLLRQQNKLAQPDSSLVHTALASVYPDTPRSRQLVDKLILIQLVRLPVGTWSARPISAYLEHLGLFDSLEEEDYQPATVADKTIPSLAERLFIAYSKALLREKAPTEKIQAFLSQTVAPLLEPHAHMLYVPYFKAKLLLATGSPEEGMAAFLPFARKKQREFWVWQVLAEFHEDQPELHLACLCKALACKTRPEFLSGIKERIIPVLVRAGEGDWAKSELDSLLEVRQKKEWGLRSAHRQMLHERWYTGGKTVALASQYAGHLRAAEELLRPPARPAETLTIVVTQLNPSKKVFSFVTPDRRAGFAAYPASPPEAGAAYVVQGSFSESFFHLRSMETLEDPGQGLAEIRKTVGGKFSQSKDQTFGFVGQVFVSPATIASSGLRHGDVVQGIAVYAPTKPGGPWKWKLA